MDKDPISYIVVWCLCPLVTLMLVEPLSVFNVELSVSPCCRQATSHLQPDVLIWLSCGVCYACQWDGYLAFVLLAIVVSTS